MTSLDKIPETLKKIPNWILWRNECRSGDRPTKLPYQVSGKLASSTDPATWNDINAVAEVEANYSGLGFVFPLDRTLTGIDLDGCRDPETGTVQPWAKQIVIDCNTYAEVSPSKTGVKLFCVGRLPSDSGKKKDISDGPRISEDKAPAIEMYDSKRYFAVTGLRLSGMPHEPQPRQEYIDQLWAKYFTQSASTTAQKLPIDIVERANRYVAKIPPAVSGQGGHNQTFHVACILVIGFGLESEQALAIMQEYNQRCQPPWSDRELQHKLADAEKQTGERGFLRSATDYQLQRIRLPKWEPPKPPKEVVTLQDAALSYLGHIAGGHDALVDLAVGDVNHALGGGVAYGEMVIVAARPSHGKTAFALQCLDTACCNRLPSAMISEEMSALALGKRTIQFAVDTPEEHWRVQMRNVEKQLADHFGSREPCYVIESCREPETAANEVRRLVESRGVKIVAVDYAQLLASKGKTRYEQITHTSIVLRQLANELRIVLIVLCQMSRSIESRNVFIPQMSDLRETGQLEQDADVILFLVWPYRIKPEKDPKEFLVFVAKNRNRPINKNVVKCEFRPSRQIIIEHRETVQEMDQYVPEFDAF